ncbi:hypothetical protein AWJ20_5165 [Sugiyamaella lignohabitans]|uniref:YMC020W-like alpha/beta hydrolase domain-containing protein n=1 Tax=Sugiyamaella lignohabitans TaxID=796027 RepID=A0A167EL61_9ASCO|nr:uncharacterized protein AWJ20_5165 [Sugiyamaella lignohabitans]ANB14204.1 hypothetical protein AWJ20_5165 [Sugiyamaella lignohabitans]
MIGGKSRLWSNSTGGEDDSIKKKGRREAQEVVSVGDNSTEESNNVSRCPETGALGSQSKSDSTTEPPSGQSASGDVNLEGGLNITMQPGGEHKSSSDNVTVGPKTADVTANVNIPVQKNPKPPESPASLSTAWYSWAWASSAPKESKSKDGNDSIATSNGSNDNDDDNKRDTKGTNDDATTETNYNRGDITVSNGRNRQDPAITSESHQQFEVKESEDNSVSNTPHTRSDSWYTSIWSLVGSNYSTTTSDPKTDERRLDKPSDNTSDKRTEDISSDKLPTYSTPPDRTPSSISDSESLKDPNVIAGPSGDRSWAFWFRSSTTSDKSADKNQNDLSEQGELAISGTSTESHPRTVKRTEHSPGPEPVNTPVMADTGSSPSIPGQTSRQANQQEQSTQPGEPVNKKPRKVIRPNVVTPSLDESYPLYTNSIRIKSSLSKFSEYVFPRFQDTLKTQYHQHPYRCAPHKIQRVVVFGVHGYFPAKVVRTFLGEPTGTSVKFAREAAESVARWADEKGYDVQIEEIALEGEGRVSHRVDKLYQLLMNWLHLIREADFIYFAAHSQGTPVAVHLLARLVEEGHVENKRLALLGMAGVSLGPMAGLDQKIIMRAISSIENDSLLELFEFQKLESVQSRKYLESLRVIIAHNTKVVFVGSLDDQLVPLYSSICSHVAHPNIYRAVYIDGEDVAPGFISNLLTIALRLRNIGSTDHGVIQQLSGALAGAITGKGHSKIYNESQVYDLTLRYALETTDAGQGVPVKVESEYEIPKPNQNNPYILPWAMRGLVNEARIRTAFSDKLQELYEEFNQWRPESKVLKDVKYRLSPIQSKL